MATRYIPYYPDTLEGQALLDNFVRTRRMLRYRDNDRVVERIRRGMPLYEVERVEQVGDNPNRNLVIHGECLSACAWLKEQGVEVDLVYIDPPFASGADYAKKVHLRRNPLVQKAMQEAAQTLDNSEMQAFEEKMYGDIWDKERYLNWMYENLMAIKSVMSDRASIYVHLDYHIGHYVKILMDEIFGEENFRNEIVWKRSTAHNDSTGFANLHDNIFYYSKGSDLFFETPMVPYSQEYIERYYNKQDKDGRKYLDRDLSAKGLKGSGYSYKWKGKDGYWRCPITTMERLEKEGRIYYTSNGTPRFKQYLDEMEGVPAQDMWTDIFAVNSQADERVDYATQKPEALLERIIKASSDEGMLVADFFGGSGVTAAVAHRLGRRFVHGDVNINSIQTARDRLVAAGAGFDMMEVKDGVSLFRNPVQTMDKLKSRLIVGLNTNTQLDSRYWAGAIVDSHYGMMPVYLPNLLDSSKRVLDKNEMNTIIRKALPDLPDDVRRVVVYYVDVDDMDELRQFIHDTNTSTLIEFELRDLKQVLDDVVMEDEAQWSLEEKCEDIFNSRWKLTLKTFSSDRVRRKIEEFNLKGEQQAIKKKGDGKAARFVPVRLSDEGLETVEWLSLDCESAEPKAPWHSTAEVRIEKDGTATVNGTKTGEPWDATISSEARPLRLKVRNVCGDETIFKL